MLVPAPLDPTIKGVYANVVSGWDEALQYYHLTIFNLDKQYISDDDTDDVIWCNLDYFDFDELRTIEPLKEVLAAFGIIAPKKFWEIVELKEGNVIKEITNNLN